MSNGATLNATMAASRTLHFVPMPAAALLLVVFGGATRRLATTTPA